MTGFSALFMNADESVQDVDIPCNRQHSQTDSHFPSKMVFGIEHQPRFEVSGHNTTKRCKSPDRCILGKKFELPCNDVHKSYVGIKSQASSRKHQVASRASFYREIMQGMFLHSLEPYSMNSLEADAMHANLAKY